MLQNHTPRTNLGPIPSRLVFHLENSGFKRLTAGLPMIFPKRLLVRLIRQAALIWLAIRGAIALLGAISFTPREVILVTAAVLVISWMDIRWSRERLMIENLAISPLRVSTIVFTSALALDLAAALLFDIFVRPALGG